MAYIRLKSGGTLSGVVEDFQEGVYKLDCSNGVVTVYVSSIDSISDHS
jgi:hypothetical protein